MITLLLLIAAGLTELARDYTRDRTREESRILLYHYTFERNVDSIRREGLRASIAQPGNPSSDANWGDGQYFTDLTPAEASNFTRAQVVTALYSLPRKWGINGTLQNIFWIEFAMPRNEVARVADLFESEVKRKLPHRGIWLRGGQNVLSASFITGAGIVVFQPMNNGNR